MLRTLRDRGPTLLVPLAWVVVAAAHARVVSETAILVAHVVMAGFIAAFAVTGWSEMDRGALRAWRAVLVAGLPVTLAGIAGFRLGDPTLLATSVVGWMLLPAAGLAYTGSVFVAARRVYYAAAGVTLLGAAVYLAWFAGLGGAATALVGLALVGVGQTVGILDAARRDGSGGRDAARRDESGGRDAARRNG